MECTKEAPTPPPKKEQDMADRRSAHATVSVHETWSLFFRHPHEPNIKINCTVVGAMKNQRNSELKVPHLHWCVVRFCMQSTTFKGDLSL